MFTGGGASEKYKDVCARDGVLWWLKTIFQKLHTPY
jgi:hypothetical protein